MKNQIKDLLFAVFITLLIGVVFSCKKKDTKPTQPIVVTPVDTVTYNTLTVKAANYSTAGGIIGMQMDIDEDYSKLKNSLGNYQFTGVTDYSGTLNFKTRIRKYYIKCSKGSFIPKYDSIIIKAPPRTDNYVYMTWK